MKRYFTLWAILLAGITIAAARDYRLHTFKKLELTDKFWCEGAHYGDFNHDGKMDIVSGPFWYEGAEFKTRHEYYPATESFKKTNPDGTETIIAGFEGALGEKNAYSANFLSYTYDFNGDGWTDILVLGFPGAESWWFENPKGKDGHWTKHTAIKVTDNESPTFGDLTGDRKPELICCSGGYIVYAEPNWKNPGELWKFHRITSNKGYGKFAHGLGYGDVSGDGRKDKKGTFVFLNQAKKVSRMEWEGAKSKAVK
jgi:hypothetical protein